MGSSAATIRRYLLTTVLAATAMWNAAADAQQFGQWTWDVTMGASQRLYDNLVGDDRVSRYDQRELRLGLGINGFIVHPAVARFRLGVDGMLSRFASGGALDSDRLGFRGDLGLFPRGVVPVRLWIARQHYDYELAERDPLSLFAVADLTSSWGGRVRLRRGPLRGLLLGAERADIEFLDIERSQVDEREFVDWSAAGARLQHHYRLERRLRKYATVNFATDDLTLTAGEHGYVSQRWRWDLSGVGIRRDLSYTTAADRQIDTFRLTNRLTRYADSGDRFIISLVAGLSDSSDAPTRHSHRLSLRYAWIPRVGVEVAPFVTFGFQETDGLSGRAPQAGVAATWSTTGRSLDALLSATGAYGRFTSSYGQVSATDSLTSLSLSMSLGHGREDRLRKILEAEWGRDDLSTAGEIVDDLPDLGVSLGGFGTQDRLRGRLSLRRSWQTRSAGAYLEWRRRQGASGFAAPGFSVEDKTFSMDLRSRRLDVVVNAGDTTTRHGTEQQVRYAAATVGLRPWRLLALRGSFRTDTRNLDSGPDVDADRIEAILEFTLGRIVLRAQVYETTERFQTGGERTNRGLMWTVIHRFEGWLPIVTGPERRGVIR